MPIYECNKQQSFHVDGTVVGMLASILVCRLAEKEIRLALKVSIGCGVHEQLNTHRIARSERGGAIVQLCRLQTW